VLIIGGGEGATLREVLRHPSVEQAVMVDIDGELIEVARRHMRSWHQGAFEDPRTDLRIGDGMAFLQGTTERFDVAIVDVCDYVEATAVAGLYNDAFMQAVHDVLVPGGIAVVQSGELGRWECANHVALARMLEKAFGHTLAYSTFVESFWSEWSFLLAGHSVSRSIADLSPFAIDAALNKRQLSRVLRFYDGATHQRMFHLPKDIRDALAAARAA
jgi:spermidine synthase